MADDILPPITTEDILRKYNEPEEGHPWKNVAEAGRTIGHGLNSIAGMADHLLGNIPSTAAGLVNSAIPGRPLGGPEEAQEASGRAFDDFRAEYPNVAKPVLEMADNPMSMSPAAFLMANPQMTKRSLGALERAKQIVAGTEGTPGQRTEKAWKAGGQFGGWNQMPVRMGDNGPETEWMRWIPTYDPKAYDPVKAFGSVTQAPLNKNWLGRYPKETAEGKLGDLLNLNPELLKYHPDLADIPLRIQRSWRDSNLGGSYGPPRRFTDEQMNLYGPTNSRIAESGAHEIAHALANRYGTDAGSSPTIEKRPWLKFGNEFSFGDSAIDRYRKNVGENVANTDMAINANDRYKDYGQPKTFPAWEYVPAEQRLTAGGRRRPGMRGDGMIERDIRGQFPQDMPPSWQLMTRPEDMRNSPSLGASLAWNMPWSAAKWGAAGYGAKKALDYAFTDTPPTQDEGQAFRDRVTPSAVPIKPSEIGDSFGRRAAEEHSNAIGNDIGKYAMYGMTGINAGGALLPGRRIIPAAGALASLLSARAWARSAQQNRDDEARLRNAQRMWGNTGLPDRSDSNQ